ncbi:hypothetical protein ABBQ38_004655 [Trebouxia sp. C0009 RCD-2024]
MQMAPMRQWQGHKPTQHMKTKATVEPHPCAHRAKEAVPGLGGGGSGFSKVHERVKGGDAARQRAGLSELAAEWMVLYKLAPPCSRGFYQCYKRRLSSDASAWRALSLIKKSRPCVPC